MEEKRKCSSEFITIWANIGVPNQMFLSDIFYYSSFQPAHLYPLSQFAQHQIHFKRPVIRNIRILTVVSNVLTILTDQTSWLYKPSKPLNINTWTLSTDPSDVTGGGSADPQNTPCLLNTSAPNFECTVTLSYSHSC